MSRKRTLRFFVLQDWVGQENGVPQPFVEEGLILGTQERDPRTGAWVTGQRRVRLLPVLPGSRVTCTDDPAVAAILEHSQKWAECDPPRALRGRRPQYR